MKMLEERMFYNVPQNEHLHPPSEEINLFCESETSTDSSQNSNTLNSIVASQPKVKAAIVTVFFIILFLALNSWPKRTRPPLQHHDIFAIKESQLVEQRFPKILWIYTQNQRDAQHMQDDLYFNYYSNLAKTANFVVREVNSLSAYEYLSGQTTKTITETMSKRTVDETVHSFLKLALLLQNGGLMIEPGTILVGNDFKWIQYMFDKYSVDLQIYNCQPQQSSLFIPKHADKYDTMILATVPNSPSITSLFSFMCQVVTSQQLKKQSTLPQRYDITGLTWNPTLRVYGFDDSISNCFNHLLKITNKHNQKCYLGMQSANINITLVVEQGSQPSAYFVANKLSGFEQLLYSKGITNSDEVKAIKGFKTNKIIKTLTQLALGKYQPASIQNTLMYNVLQAPGNKEIFLEELPQREIELCLVIMQPLDKEQLIYTSTLFREQTFINWKLVMPAVDIKNAPTFQDYRVTVIQSKSNKVHNIEKAVTKHCPHRGYAVLLNFNETFENQSALHSIAKAAQPRQVAGVYIPLKTDGQLYNVRQSYTKFYRYDDGIVNPKLDVMKHMINHFRVFSVQTFKTIPQFALRDWNGKYFQDRLIFLMDFHDLIHRELIQPELLFALKKNANLWNIPTKVSVLDDVALLKINKLQQVNKEQLKLTRTRVSARNIKTILLDLHHYKVPMSKMVAFNPGDDFIPVQQKSGPQRIPRIIHQVWLGSEIPPAKQYFIQKTKKIYPSFQIKVWREQNITRELFPTTYDIIQTIIEFNKGSPYNKLATVTDIMRHEILYREGGLWKDAGMNMLRPIPDAFLKYKLILATDRLYQYRYIQGMCFFGNMPKYQNLLRINNYRNLNRMRIHSNDPFPIAGPVDFRQLLVRQQEFDSQIILIPYQTFYPGQIGQHPQNDLCTTDRPKKNQKYQIVESGWYLLSGCEQKYPYAFAIQHNNYGSSWVGARQLEKL